MPMRHARALAPLAATLLAGAAAAALGIGRRASAPPLVPVARPKLPSPPPPSDMRRPGPTHLWRTSIVATLVFVLLAGVGIALGYQVRSDRQMQARAIALTAGDPNLGRDLARRYGCAGCHTIPGVPGASGQVGPSLQGFAARVYVGGVAANTPDTLIQWIVNPRSIDPKTAMPVTGISRTEARHVAAYLYTLR